MRKVMSAALVAVALLLILAPSSDAGGPRGRWHGGTRVFVGVGPGWYGPYPYWYYPRPYYWGYGYPYYYGGYPYAYPPPVVVPQEPQVYVQQEPVPATPAPPAASSAPDAQGAPPQGFWYYCASSREYYPRVPTCAEAWIKVPPRQE